MIEEELVAELREIAIHNDGIISMAAIQNECSITYQGCLYRFGSIEEIAEMVGAKCDRDIQTSYGARQLAKLVEEITGEAPTLERNWDWLRNPSTGRKLFVDIYLENKSVAIEYDGEQHFRFIKHMHVSMDNFIKQLERDRAKDKLLSEHGIKLLRFRYDEPLNMDYVRGKLAEFL